MATSSRLRRFGWRCAVVLVCGSAVVAPAARGYQTVEVDSLKVTIDSDWAPRAAPGYLPVRFDIANLGEARVIELVGQGSRYFRMTARSSPTTTSLHQTVRLAKGDRVRLTLNVPIFADSESIRFELREDGRTLEHFNYEGFQSRATPAEASVLMVADSSGPFSAIAGRLSRMSARLGLVLAPSTGVATLSSAGPAGASSLDFVLDPVRLPANWIGLTGLRAVAIGAGEWTHLSDGQQSALLGWTACGGDLIFVDGRLNTLLPSARGEAASDPERVVGRHFLGRVHVMTSATLATAGLANVLSAADRTRDINVALPVNTAPDWGVIEDRGFRLRIPGVEGIPARVYLTILILFSLLIGPVNYWLLWRKGRQVLLVLTAPLISAVFIALLAAYAVAGEGLSVQGRAVTFTMLDQVLKQATTRASVSLYAAGMTPSGGLRFPGDVAVFPTGTDGIGARDNLDVDLTDGQRFAGGLIRARSATNFEEIAFRPARERLTFSRDAEGLSVTNGLEASIKALFYRDGETLYRLDGPLQAGGRQTLKGGPLDAPRSLPVDVSLPAKFTNLFKDQPPGSYLAVLDRSPFWEPGVSGVIERSSLHVVLGWPEGQR